MGFVALTVATKIHLLQLSSLTMYIAVVGAAWPLVGSPRKGQAMSHLSQKHFLCYSIITASATGRF